MPILHRCILHPASGHERRVAIRLGRSAFCYADVSKNGMNMSTSMAIDTTLLEEEQYSSKRKVKDWPLTNMGYLAPSDTLHVGVTAKVFLQHDDRQEVWVGKVVKRTDGWCEMQLWGSGKLFRVPFGHRTLKRSGAVPEFRHAEYRAVCERQRRGLPAWSSRAEAPALEQPTLELDDALTERIEVFSREKGMTFEQGVERLLNVGFRRIRALQKWVAKTRQKAS
jgi:hypothetical protein